jgi:putative peptidoglycan lipid II flippase
MFSVAIATVLFPTLSRLAARGDLDGFRETVGRGLRQIAFLLVPAAALSAVLAEPIVRLLYQRGAWTPSQTPVTADVLAAFSAGLLFNGWMLMLNRAFFSMQANWIPTAVALANLFLNAVLDYAFYPVGAWGIALSTAIVNIAGTATLLVLLRRKLGHLEEGRTTKTVGRIVVAAGLLAASAYAVWKLLEVSLGTSFGAQLVSLGAAFVVSGAAYFLTCKVLHVREYQTLVGLLRRRTA